MRRRLAAAAVALAIFGGGVLLGVNLQDASPSTAAGASGQARPAVASGSGAGPSTSAGSAVGGGPTPVEVVCATLRGALSGLPVLGGCTKPGVTGGAGTATVGSLGKAGSVTVAWNGTGTTTFVFWSTRPTPNLDRCPGGEAEIVLHGSVTANSPVGTANGGVRGNIGAKVCIDPANQMSLLPGHTFKL